MSLENLEDHPGSCETILSGQPVNPCPKNAAQLQLPFLPFILCSSAAVRLVWSLQTSLMSIFFIILLLGLGLRFSYC